MEPEPFSSECEEANKDEVEVDADAGFDASSLDMSRDVQLNALPDEILEFILTYLPPYADLQSCALVCKRWHAIVQNLIRRSKMNLHKGLLDFRLSWEVFTQQTAMAVAVRSRATAAHSSTAAAATCASSPPLPIIAGRFSHSAVRHSNAMYVFGGGSSSDTTFNDLWRFDLSALRWERPLSMGSYPSPKGSASMVCWREQLVLFGGWRYPSLHPPYQPWCLFDELHYYDLATQRWTVRANARDCSPPPMAGHSASVHGDRMVVFGGYQIADGVNSNSNETWCLDLHEQRWWQPRFVGNTKPPPRYGQFQLELDEQHLLIVGGCGGPNCVYSDAWLLDMTRRDVWTWRTLPVRNKKFAASHMWCNPACKVDSKLVVLGPTPNMPQDFQMMKQTRVPVGGGMPAPRRAPNNPFERQRAAAAQQAAERLPGALRAVQPLNHNRLDNFRLGGGGGGLHAQGPDEQYFANRRAILNQHQQQQNNNFVNNSNNNNNYNNNNINNNLQPRTGRLSELHAAAVPPPPPALSAPTAAAANEEHNHNRPSSSAAAAANAARANGARNDNDSAGGANGANGAGMPHDVEAAHRLQRNLALRCRDNEPLLPKRFDELYEDPFRMAAFNVQQRPRSGVSKDHNERIRRMEEKMNAIRNSRRNAAVLNAVDKSCASGSSIKEPSPKRVKRNVLSLFVCDLAAALDPDDPHLQWVEYKNYGVIPGAPERLILSTMVAGHGELILFGGVHKETLSEITHQVSNSVHFLSAPRDIV